MSVYQRKKESPGIYFPGLLHRLFWLRAQDSDLQPLGCGPNELLESWTANRSPAGTSHYVNTGLDIALVERHV